MRSLQRGVRSHRTGNEICKGTGRPPAKNSTHLNHTIVSESPNEATSSIETKRTIAGTDSISQFLAPSRIKLNDLQREAILAAPVTTCSLLDYATRCKKAIRSAMAAAAFEYNYDPIVALKIVLSAAPPRRRGEHRKKLLDAYFESNIGCIMDQVEKCSAPKAKTRAACARRLNSQGADASAMAALSAGMPGRALKRLTQNGTLPVTEETIEALRKLHPQCEQPIPVRNTTIHPSLQPKFVGPALKAMKQSAPGPSGLRADHILMAFPNGIGDSLILVLKSIAEGRAPRWLADARLFALPKKSNGVRPIAVGETLRRLAATVMLRSAHSSLPPLARQFIVRSDGCVTVANIVRSTIERFNEACVVTVDLRNAFNSVDRNAVLTAVNNTQLCAYTQWAYGLPSILRFGTSTLSSSTGVQQGDPAGPVLFAFALAGVLDNLRNLFPGDMLDIWYADDGYILGNCDSVAKAFDMLIDPLKAIGLQINLDKCALWTHNNNIDNIIPGVSTVIINESEFPLTVLGLPVAGSREAMSSFAVAAVTKTDEAMKPLSLLHHAQGETAILRYFGPTSRLQHFSRFSLDPSIAQQLAGADAITLKHFERIVGRPLPHGWEPIAASSISSGGIGLSLLSDIDMRAKSISAIESAVRVTKEIIDLDAQLGFKSEMLSEVLEELQQRPALSECFPGALRAAAAENLSHMKLLADSFASPHASAFLSAMPGPQTTMSNEEFRDALWFRFGLPPPTGHQDCSPDPRHDPLGLHRLGCRNAAPSRTQRHDEMVTVLAKAALNADPLSFQVAREERLADADNSRQRPGDIALNMGDGRTLADLTVASPFGAACQTSSRIAGTPAAAASEAYDRKVLKWKRLLDDHELHDHMLVSTFQPLAVTALGVWDNRSFRWLRKFSDICASSLGIDNGSAFADLMTRLSVALWRGNSRLLRSLRVHCDWPTD